MLRVPASALLTVLLIFPAFGLSTGPDFASIQPIHWYAQERAQIIEQHQPETAHCTAWAFRQGKVLTWVTAYHCVATFPPIDGSFYIGNRPVQVIRTDAFLDLALFAGGPPNARGFALAKRAPPPLTPIWAAGYPLGQHRLHVTAGVWSQGVDDDYMSVYNLGVTFGFSGGPVLNMRNQIVGIVQQKECWDLRGYCPMGRGARLDQLRRFLLSYP